MKEIIKKAPLLKTQVWEKGEGELVDKKKKGGGKRKMKCVCTNM
jgi:hypothetical protein